MFRLFLEKTARKSATILAMVLIIATCESPLNSERPSNTGVHDSECEAGCEKTFYVSDGTPTTGVTTSDGPYVFETLPSGAGLLLRGQCALNSFKGVLVHGKISGKKSDSLLAELDRNRISRDILVMERAIYFKVKRQTGELVSYATDVDCLR